MAAVLLNGYPQFLCHKLATDYQSWPWLIGGAHEDFKKNSYTGHSLNSKKKT